METIKMEVVMNIVCLYFKVDPFALKSIRRETPFQIAREAYCYLCQIYCSETPEEIGKTIGRKDTSVAQFIDTLKKKRGRDKKLRLQIEFLEKKIEEKKISQ